MGSSFLANSRKLFRFPSF